MSVHKWSMVGYEPPSFVGSSNFVALINDQRFISSLARTLYFTALGLVSNIPVGFAIALLLAENFPTRNLLRALLILPMV
ncbi:MAG TPA: sugar ABC transporter permease, partial [Pseudolabrys sp.]|nr:sugar ABC transporter permease [Pseudolabrys sp.]